MFALSVLLSNSALFSPAFEAGKSVESTAPGSGDSEAFHGAKSEPLSSSLFRLTSDSSLQVNYAIKKYCNTEEFLNTVRK